MFSRSFKRVGLHYTAFRDVIREDSRQTTPSRGVTPRKKFAVKANVESRVRPRAHACTWREACKAADYVLEHFGNPLRDRGIWVWYCQRLGLNQFLDLADEVISSARQGEQIAPVDPDSLPKAAQNISAPSLCPLCG